jgi:hypothetical protein
MVGAHGRSGPKARPAARIPTGGTTTIPWLSPVSESQRVGARTTVIPVAG